MTEQMFSYLRIDFTVDRGREFARYASGPDWAVAIDEMQSTPHRCAARPQRLANRLRLICHTIRQLRPRINAEIEATSIEWRGFEQLLRKIVRGNAAVCRNAEICGKECKKRNHNGWPFLKFRITQPERRQPPNPREPD